MTCLAALRALLALVESEGLDASVSDSDFAVIVQAREIVRMMTDDV